MTTHKPSSSPSSPQNENFILQYSPRTEYSMSIENEEQLYKELKLNFDPITIKIIKKHFKERLGMLTKEDFVAILKNHLLAFQPHHPQREKILTRLLIRLFGDIDLNDNGTLEWNEFTNYIIHSSNAQDKSQNNKDYRLKFYTPSPHCIKPSELSEVISYAFFIEKYNVIGVVQEGKSTILFFEVKKCKKLKCYIDLKDIQGMVDIIEFTELNKKAVRILAKEEENKKINRSKMHHNMINRNERRKDSNASLSDDDKKKTKRKSNNNNNNNTNNNNGGSNGLSNGNSNINIGHTLLSKEEIVKASTSRKLSILCACFIPEFDIILVAGTNNTITAWHFNGGEIKNVNVTQDFVLFKDELRIAVLIADSPQYSMIWDPQLRHLFTGQRDGRILKWDLTRPHYLSDDVFDIKTVHDKENAVPKKITSEVLESRRLKEQIKLKSLRHRGQVDTFLNDKSKNESVSCLLLLTKLQLLAASYYSGYIVLWDTLLKDYRKCYCDQSTGIYSMAFDSNKNLLFTCGFDHDIYVYDPYIDSNCIYKLTGHPWSINSIDVNEKESEMFSLDILGNIKVWDTQLLLNFQTIKLNEEYEDNAKKTMENSKNKKLASNIRMLYIKKYKKIFIYGTKLLAFETDRTNCPDLADDQVICSCYYDKVTKSLLSFCLRKIKIWNVLTGKVRQIYDDPMGNEITAVIVDKNIKRGFIGDNVGKIRNINLKNGYTIKDLTPHSTEIKFICHSMTLNIVASCSIDNVIKIHNDEELMETEVIKELTIPQYQVRAMCLVDRFARLAIGLSNGVCRFYDIEHFHYDSDLAIDNPHIKDEVTALASVEQAELVFCCNSLGSCKLMVTPPSTAKYNIVYEFKNKTTSASFPIAIISIEFDKKGGRLFLGDAFGNINCLNISTLYTTIDTVISTEERNFDVETIITKENFDTFAQLQLPVIWHIEAHKESIRHLHYIDLEPQILISTSHDLRVKVFEASTGKYKDEFKQSSNRYKPIPIGIKYYLLDPFGTEDNDKPPIEKYYSRKDIEDFVINVNNESESQQIADYSKKITEYNAKEKLYLNCRNVVCPITMSNNWHLDIDVKKVMQKEEEEFQELVKVVDKIEKITKETELILQDKSIYSESYKPKYIEEMNDFETIKSFSLVISERLRHVKLAVSKANLNQSKMVDLGNKNKGKVLKKDNTNMKVKKKMMVKSKTTANLNVLNEKPESPLRKNNNKDDKGKMLKQSSQSRNDILIGKTAKTGTHSNNANNNTTTQSHVLNLKTKLMPIVNKQQQQQTKRASIVKMKDMVHSVKNSALAEHFGRYKEDFDHGFKQMLTPFKMLIKKSKDRKRILSSNMDPEENEKEMEMEEERKKRFASMEHELKRIEQEYYY